MNHQDKENIRWHCLRRLSEIDAEYRIAFFRALAILVLFSVHMGFYFFAVGSPELEKYHVIVSSVALASAATSMLTIVALGNRFFPRWLATVILMADLVCIGCLISGRPEGPGPLLQLFLILIVTAGLRFRLDLVWFATIGSFLGYGANLWIRLNATKNSSELHDRLDQCLQVAIILLVGLLVGQVVRRVHQLGKIAIDSGTDRQLKSPGIAQEKSASRSHEGAL